ncbi:hypothetical protein MalM25_25640 [Planctomycetes bacterium MalM25]|nr:hypothetical protein MalM25_25640 [Planctomycetes bacterium MalM25]
MTHRAVVLGWLVSVVGCYASYHREHLASQIPRADGTVLAVECVSSVRSKVSSISPSLGSDPRVTVIKDRLTFVVTPEAITLNGGPPAELGSGVERVLITIDEEGFRVEADGEPVSLAEPDLEPELSDPAPTDR